MYYDRTHVALITLFLWWVRNRTGKNQITLSFSYTLFHDTQCHIFTLFQSAVHPNIDSSLNNWNFPSLSFQDWIPYIHLQSSITLQNSGYNCVYSVHCQMFAENSLSLSSIHHKSTTWCHFYSGINCLLDVLDANFTWSNTTKEPQWFLLCNCVRMFSYLNDHPSAAVYHIDRMHLKITLLKNNFGCIFDCF